MARARNIKPGFFKNELLAELPVSTRLIFIGLWCLADREGRLENRPKRIKLELLPFDSVVVGQALVELEQHGFIERYEASGLQVIHILNFSKHQSPHGTERDSHLPGKDGALTVNKRGKNGYVLGNQQLDNSALTVNPPLDNALNPDSLNPDSPNPDIWEAIAAPATQAPKPVKRASQIPPDFYPNETGVNYAEERRVSLAVELVSFRNHHQAKGSTMKDWQAAWRTWCDKSVEFGRAGGGVKKAAPVSFAQQAADIARTTVPSRIDRDPALVQLEDDFKKAVPMPDSVRQALGSLTRKIQTGS